MFQDGDILCFEELRYATSVSATRDGKPLYWKRGNSFDNKLTLECKLTPRFVADLANLLAEVHELAVDQIHPEIRDARPTIYLFRFRRREAASLCRLVS